MNTQCPIIDTVPGTQIYSYTSTVPVSLISNIKYSKANNTPLFHLYLMHIYLTFPLKTYISLVYHIKIVGINNNCKMKHNLFFF